MAAISAAQLVYEEVSSCLLMQILVPPPAPPKG